MFFGSEEMRWRYFTSSLEMDLESIWEQLLRKFFAYVRTGVEKKMTTFPIIGKMGGKKLFQVFL